MIYELVLQNFDSSLEFVFSLLLLQPFNFSPVSFACNFQDWGCVILREIDFLIKICWSIPCLHPSWKVHTCITQVSRYIKYSPVKLIGGHSSWKFEIHLIIHWWIRWTEMYTKDRNATRIDENVTNWVNWQIKWWQIRQILLCS